MSCYFFIVYCFSLFETEIKSFSDYTYVKINIRTFSSNKRRISGKTTNGYIFLGKSLGKEKNM